MWCRDWHWIWSILLTHSSCLTCSQGSWFSFWKLPYERAPGQGTVWLPTNRQWTTETLSPATCEELNSANSLMREPGCTCCPSGGVDAAPADAWITDPLGESTSATNAQIPDPQAWWNKCLLFVVAKCWDIVLPSNRYLMHGEKRKSWINQFHGNIAWRAGGHRQLHGLLKPLNSLSKPFLSVARPGMVLWWSRVLRLLFYERQEHSLSPGVACTVSPLLSLFPISPSMH